MGVPPVGGPVFGLTAVMVGVNSKWSAALGALDRPPGIVTVTSTVPTAPAGDIAVIAVEDFTVKLVAFVEPNLTALTFLKKVPSMATTVPPVAGPLLGVTVVTVGSLAAYAGATLPVIAYPASTPSQAIASAIRFGPRAIRRTRGPAIAGCEWPISVNMFRLL
jgi:hypothetical protein